jgi:hypothetical protein
VAQYGVTLPVNATESSLDQPMVRSIIEAALARQAVREYPTVEAARRAVDWWNASPSSWTDAQRLEQVRRYWATARMLGLKGELTAGIQADLQAEAVAAVQGATGAQRAKNDARYAKLDRARRGVYDGIMAQQLARGLDVNANGGERYERAREFAITMAERARVRAGR